MRFSDSRPHSAGRHEPSRHDVPALIQDSSGLELPSVTDVHGHARVSDVHGHARFTEVHGHARATEVHGQIRFSKIKTSPSATRAGTLLLGHGELQALTHTPTQPKRRQLSMAKTRTSATSEESQGTVSADGELPEARPRPSSAARSDTEAPNSRRQSSKSASKSVHLDSALKVLSEHPFFQGIRLGAISNFARVSMHRVFDGSYLHHGEGPPLTHDENILTEGEHKSTSEVLWVIEHGAVIIEEGGEILGTLREDTAFGCAVSFAWLESQPFTVRAAPEEQEGTLSVWCVPNRAIRNTLHQYPEAKKLLAERVDLQMKELLEQRVSRLLFFSHCGQGMFHLLYSKMTVDHYAKGSEIVRGGEVADTMLIIVSGTIRMGSPVKFDAAMMHSSTEPKHAQASNPVLPSSPFRTLGKDGGQKVQRRPTHAKTTPIKQNLQFHDSTNTIDSEPEPLSDADPHEVASAADEGSIDGDRQEDDHAQLDDHTRLDDKVEQTEDEKDESDGSSSLSSSDSEEYSFLPKSGNSGTSQKKQITISKEAIIFGEGAILGYNNTRTRSVFAAKDCVAMTLHKDDFVEVVERHPRERRQFEEMAAACYVEWKRSDISRLSSVDIFSRCSEPFLLQITQVAKLQLFFAGENIITQGLVPRGLLLLMSGLAEQVAEDGTTSPVHSPQSFGTLEWLGVRVNAEQRDIRAKELCLVFVLSREHLLDALKDHAHESTAMVQQVMRHNGMRLSITSGLEQLAEQSVNHKRVSAKRDPLMLQVWHLPFCRGCDPNFLTKFTIELKVCKLVPGQMLVSAEPGKTRKGEDPDFLIILICGSVQVDRSSPVRPNDVIQVQAPLVITGFNRKHRAAVITTTVCEVHRLSIPSCQRLAEEWPKDTRRVLERMIAFQTRREAQVGSGPWWKPTTSLRHQAWFKDSDEEFLQCLCKKLNTAIYLPGEVLVHEGDPADSTMLLECGTVFIEKVDTRTLVHTDWIGEVHDGYWIGEMAMFAGESRRRATITAVTICKLQRLLNKALVELLLTFPKERQWFRKLAERRLRGVEKERLEDHDFFKDFDREFLNRVRQKCIPQVFFANEILMKQGEIADCLFILGSECIVSLEVDGAQVKRIAGRACLGTKALLSHQPVKRASTVITQTVCAVHTLTRDDWLDTLKLYPLQQSWLKNFAKSQIGKVHDAHESFMKKRAWEKIQQREAVAMVVHRERIANVDPWDRPRSQLSSDRPQSQLCSISPNVSLTGAAGDLNTSRGSHKKADSGTPRASRGGTGCPSLTGSLTPRHTDSVLSNFVLARQGSKSRCLMVPLVTARLEILRDKASTPVPTAASTSFRGSQLQPESWDCFNGAKTLVPHLELPKLHFPSDGADSANAEKERRLSHDDSCGSLAYTECEEALGIAAHNNGPL